MATSGRKGEYWCKSGTEFSSDCFILDNIIFYRKKNYEFYCTPIGDWKDAPVNTREIYSSAFYMYNMATKETTTLDGIRFYRALSIFRENGGISKIDEEYVYDKVLDDDFVMYCLTISSYI